jgi:peptidylprolyl isomerase domain and WD repeat-containing protein 1
MFVEFPGDNKRLKFELVSETDLLA